MFGSEIESPFTVMTFKLDVFTIVKNEKVFTRFENLFGSRKEKLLRRLQINRLLIIGQNTVTSEFRFESEI